MIEVLTPGRLDLVMDGGRPGLGASGVPAGGVADPAAYACANQLVGNPPNAAALEILLGGPRLRFPQGGVVALTGSRFATSRSHGTLAWHETLVLRPGETLSVGHAVEGCRCWLAVRGGFAVPPVLGSRSTFLPGGWGGYHGRALRRDDVLATGRSDQTLQILRGEPGLADDDAPLRVVPGPQLAHLSDAGLAALFNSVFHVSPACDRRGVQLSGAKVTRRDGDIASQAVLPGAIQIPPDGAPIVLGWDGPVTGGYPVAACVIGADLARVAQLKPGDSVRFSTVSVADARAAWRLPCLRNIA